MVARPILAAVSAAASRAVSAGTVWIASVRQAPFGGSSSLSDATARLRLAVSAHSVVDEKPRVATPDVEDAVLAMGEAERILWKAEARASAADRRVSELKGIFDSFMDHIPDILAVKRLDGRYLVANRAMEEVHGIPREQLVGMFDSDLHDMQPEATLLAVEARQRIAEGGGTTTFDLPIRVAPGGEVRIFETIYAPLSGEDGSTIGMSAIGRDVTDRRRVEGELRMAKAQVENASRSKTRFLAAASHDLRQPAQAALIFVEDAARKSVGSPAEASITNATRALEVMRAMLDSMLDVSRLEAGATRADLIAFPISPLLDEIEAIHGEAAAAKGLDLSVVRSDAVVRSDPVLLGRILRNIVENAVRYTEEGRVVVGTRSTEGCLRLDVTDTGPGIASGDLPRIWEEFDQLANPERDRDKGMGLGLSMVRRLGMLLGHPVGVNSKPGIGSTFWISVPLAPPKLVAVSPPAAERHPDLAPDQDRQPSSAERPFLLVIDDDAMLRSALSILIGGRGFEVATAEGVDDALAVVARSSRIPDLIVADYRLRGEERGTGAVLRLREATRSVIPALILTGEIADEARDDAEALGARLLQKPVRPQDLIEAIRLAIG